VLGSDKRASAAAGSCGLGHADLADASSAFYLKSRLSPGQLELGFDVGLVDRLHVGVFA
jgi:hypothetical protein